MSSPYPYTPHHASVYQQGPNLYAQPAAPLHGTLTHNRRTSLGGHNYNPYPTSPHSPSTRPPEAPLLNNEIFLCTSAHPYRCSCGEVFRGRSQIGAHVQLNLSHRDLHPGKNLRPCVRNCGRMIDDLEDLVDHLERKHNIQQDIRGIFTPFFDRPRSSTTTILYTPISPLPSLELSSFAMQQQASFAPSYVLRQVDPTHSTGLTGANPAHRSQLSPPPNPGSHYPPLCDSLSPSIKFTTTTNTTESDTGHWRASGPPLVREVKPYTCKCGKVYKRWADLETHIGKPVKNHYDTTVYKFNCGYCDKKHPTEEGMQRHMELTHNMQHTKADVQQIALAVSALSSPSESSAKRRKPSTHASNMVEAPPSRNDAALKPLPPKIAEYYRTLEPFKCKCGGGFTSHPSLMTHVQYYQKKGFGEAHGDASGGDRYLHPCMVCNQFKFTTQKQLKFHLNEHHKMEYVK